MRYFHHPACEDRDECDFESGLRPHCWQTFEDDLLHERMRAHEKHRDGSAENLDWFDFTRWLSILMEEVGEVARVVCELNLRNIEAEEAKREILKELVQVGAMSEAWAMAIQRAEP